MHRTMGAHRLVETYTCYCFLEFGIWKEWKQFSIGSMKRREFNRRPHHPQYFVINQTRDS